MLASPLRNDLCVTIENATGFDVSLLVISKRASTGTYGTRLIHKRRSQ